MGPDNTIGIRIPTHPFGTDLVAKIGYPITSSSVNRHGETPLNNPAMIIQKFGEEIDLIIDAGIGRISHICQVMELGFDGVLLNSAVVSSKSPEKFAEALSLGMKAVQTSIKAGPMEQRAFATASTSNKGKPFSK